MESSLQFLSAEDILGAQDIEYAVVAVPEWKHPVTGADRVRIKSLSGIEVDAFRTMIAIETPAVGNRPASRKVNDQGLRAKFVALSIVDSEGKRLFTDDQVEALGKKSNAALQRVFDAGMKLSRASDDEVTTLGNASEPTPGPASS